MKDQKKGWIGKGKYDSGINVHRSRRLVYEEKNQMLFH